MAASEAAAGTGGAERKTRARLIDAADFSLDNGGTLNFLKATGVEGVIVRVPPRLADGGDHAAELIDFKRHVESHGLELSVLHCGNLPKSDVVYGREGREQQAAAWLNIVRDIGAAGVPLTATTFQGIGHFRTPRTPGRGGSTYSTFKADLLPPDERDDEHGKRAHEPISAEAMWANLGWFYERLMPVAEAAGVRVCLHPDDPPQPYVLAGAARIASSIENYHRIFDLRPSESNAMLFCQGCVAEMGGDIYAAIRSVAGRGKIGVVHFRDIRGTPLDFVETFIDEGQNDMLLAMQTYKESGFEGPFMLDHTPTMPEGFSSSHGHAYANGYLKALIQIVYGR
jgi:mannonate dehydratase